MIKEMSIDLETYSDVDISKCGAYKYAESDNFEILLFGVSVDGEPINVYDLACGDEIPEDILAALSDETVASILEASEKIAVFKSANMSLGINMMVELCKKATKILYPEFDIEIVEAHHNRKLDAPSGTAMMIASAIDQEISDNVEYVYDRHSVNKARSKNEIGISSIRGGNIVGEHSAMFISDEEILTISHSAQTRDVFAKGALTAAKFMSGKDKGYYTMSDVIAQYTGE